MRIGGIVDISTKDIPGKVAMVFFTSGCNFSCEFCHNKNLLRKDIGKKRNQCQNEMDSLRYNHRDR
ncbi:MAG: 4Fe-4S cluster-binding domain-containing protein, partial [Candidatus Hermodarchaeota archaeon]